MQTYTHMIHTPHLNLIKKPKKKTNEKKNQIIQKRKRNQWTHDGGRILVWCKTSMKPSKKLNLGTKCFTGKFFFCIMESWNEFKSLPKRNDYCEWQTNNYHPILNYLFDCIDCLFDVIATLKMSSHHMMLLQYYISIVLKYYVTQLIHIYKGGGLVWLVLI